MVDTKWGGSNEMVDASASATVTGHHLIKCGCSCIMSVPRAHKPALEVEVGVCVAGDLLVGHHDLLDLIVD